MRPRIPRGSTVKHQPGWALLVGLGLLLAMAGARIPQPDDSDVQALLWVNGRPVTGTQLHQAEQRMLPGNGDELSEAERDLLVELLIDEELLLQRAERLGVLDADPGVRKAIVQAAIDEIVLEFLSRSPGQQELEVFYWRHRAMFERPARLSVTALRFDSLAAAQHARASVSAGDEWAQLEASPAANPLSYLPDSPLPTHVLRRYLGPGPASAAESLEPGQISQPVEGAGGAYLLRVTDAVYSSVPEFGDIEAVVREEYLSRGREAALTRKLAVLWSRADIQFNNQAVTQRPGQYARQAAK